MFVQHLPHDFADRPGRADHCNAWQHLWVPFIQGQGCVIAPVFSILIGGRFGKTALAT
jgi:hypothetical protein